MIGKILKTIKATVFKDKLDDLYKQEFNFGTEEDLNQHNPIAKEINYAFDGYIGDSQAFLTYNMAYEKLIKHLIQTMKNPTIKKGYRKSLNYHNLRLLWVSVHLIIV